MTGRAAGGKTVEATDGDSTSRHRRLGAAIRRHREAAGWSQDTLAEAAHLLQGQISNWERATRSVPGIDDLAAIEDAMGLIPGTLLVEAGYARLPSSAREMLRMDPALSPERREIVLDLYDTQAARSKTSRARR